MKPDGFTVKTTNAPFSYINFEQYFCFLLLIFGYSLFLKYKIFTLLSVSQVSVEMLLLKASWNYRSNYEAGVVAPAWAEWISL